MEIVETITEVHEGDKPKASAETQPVVKAFQGPRIRFPLTALCFEMVALSITKVTPIAVVEDQLEIILIITWTWSGPRWVAGYTEAHACAWHVCQLSLSDP
jgi:hypothetical protein